MEIEIKIKESKEDKKNKPQEKESPMNVEIEDLPE